jgi:hypothetical protein
MQAHACTYTHTKVTKGTMTPQVHTQFLSENFTETALETRHRWDNTKLILYKQICHCSSSGSTTDQLMWDLWMMKWYWTSFLCVLWFPLTVLIPRNAAFLSHITQGQYNDLFMVKVQYGLGFIPP